MRWARTSVTTSTPCAAGSSPGAAVVSLPLSLASGAVGFAHYATFLYPAMTFWQSKGLAIGVCLLSMMLIYRRIGFSRGDALYLACLTFAVVAYFVSRRALRKFGSK